MGTRCIKNIEIGLAVFEQWRTWWSYPPFSTANIDSIIKTVRVEPMVTMKYFGKLMSDFQNPQKIDVW